MRSGSLIATVSLLFLGILLIISGVLLINKQIEDEPSADWFGVSESFVVPAGDYVIREKELVGGVLEIIFTVTKGDFVKFLALDESNYLKWIDGQSYQSPAFVQEGGSSLTDSGELYIFITDEKWFFIWDNSYNLTTDKEITALVRYQPHHILDR